MFLWPFCPIHRQCSVFEPECLSAFSHSHTHTRQPWLGYSRLRTRTIGVYLGQMEGNLTVTLTLEIKEAYQAWHAIHPRKPTLFAPWINGLDAADGTFMSKARADPFALRDRGLCAPSRSLWVRVGPSILPLGTATDEPFLESPVSLAQCAFKRAVCFRCCGNKRPLRLWQPESLKTLQFFGLKHECRCCTRQPQQMCTSRQLACAIGIQQKHCVSGPSTTLQF